MTTSRTRFIYLAATLVVMVLGLSSRRYGAYLPVFIAEYAGDTLWSLMVFLGISFLFPATKSLNRGGIALAFSYLMEVSQFYHAPWIDALRETTLGGLILGFGFLWSDLICYTVGIGIGVALDCCWRRTGKPIEVVG